MSRLNAASSPARTSLAALLLGALTVTFGLQLLRVLIVEMAVYLTQIRDVSSTMVGVMGLGIFLCGFLEPVVRRVLGERNALRVVFGGLALVRLAEQAASSLPVDLALSIAGTVLFLWSLPLLFRLVRAEGRAGNAHAAIAFPVGPVLSTPLSKASSGPSTFRGRRAAARTLSYWPLRSLKGCSCGGSLRTGARRRAGARRSTARPPRVGHTWPFGPALALELLLFQNVAQQTALIGWPQPAGARVDSRGGPRRTRCRR